MRDVARPKLTNHSSPSARRSGTLALRRRLRALAKATGLRAGFEITRVDPRATAAGRRRAVLEREGVELVVDAGASYGEYVTLLRASGYEGHVISLEPQSAVFPHLLRRASKDDRWAAFPWAVGEEEAVAELHVAANSISSSLLPMTETHVSGYPRSETIATDRVTIRTIDSIIDELRPDDEKNPFLKLDVQGYELPALRGARESLCHFAAVEVELSLQVLYEGQALLPTVWEHLEQAGFACVGLEPAFWHRQTGELLQVNALFTR